MGLSRRKECRRSGANCPILAGLTITASSSTVALVWGGEPVVNQAGGEQRVEGALKLGALVTQHLSTAPESPNDIGQEGGSYLN